VGFEPAIPVFEWEKTFHALDRAATVIGAQGITSNNCNAFTDMQPLSVGLTGEAWELSNKMVLSLIPHPNCVEVCLHTVHRRRNLLSFISSERVSLCIFIYFGRFKDAVSISRQYGVEW
jgi:hypothetical protein